MKTKNAFLFAIFCSSLGMSVQANIIQVDFTGTIGSVYDGGATSVFNGTAAIGNHLAGVFTFDDAVANGLSQGTGAYSDPSLATDWVTSSITVNGTTYTLNPVTGYTNIPIYDYATVYGNAGSSNAVLHDQNYGYNGYDYLGFAANYLQIGGGNSTPFNGDTSLSNFENVLASLGNSGSFIFVSEIYNPNGPFQTNAQLTGTIDSTTITRLDQPTTSVPEPSSLVLLAAGMLGLGFTRRTSFKKLWLKEKTASPNGFARNFH